MSYKKGDKVYVTNWGNQYSDVTKWVINKRVNVFPFKTKIPDYSGTSFHWHFEHEPNLNLNGTVNKYYPTKLKSKTPIYKDYKYEVIEVIKHPNAGEYCQTEEIREYWKDKGGMDDKYTTEDLLLIASTHTSNNALKCYVVIECTGVSTLTLQQYAEQQFNATLNAHYCRYSLKDLTQEVIESLPKEIISKIYDVNDDVLFGSSIIKGKVSYKYLAGKFTKDGVPLYLNCSIEYDGKGNSNLPENSIIMPFKDIEAMFPNNK